MSIRDLKELNRALAELPPGQDEDEAEAPYYYYDSHPTRKDLMSEADVHYKLIMYLVNLLQWLYRKEGWFVGGNLSIYQTPDRKEYPVAPDVGLVKEVVLTREERRRLKSWRMWLDKRPAPTVVFEISSEDTWKEDLNQKPETYQKMGVKEYFAYDPHDPPVWREERRKKAKVRLRGWRFSAGKIEELTPDERGWLWSEELDSWLGADEEFLRLYNREGRQRLTGEEAAIVRLREMGIDPENLES